MTKSELTNEFYLRVYEQKEQSAPSVAEVLKNFDHEDIKEIADIVKIFCKEKGINLKDPAIAEVVNLPEDIKYEKWKNTVKDLLETAGKSIEKISPSDKGKSVAEMQTALNLAFAEIDSFDEAAQIYTIENHKKDCQKSIDSKELHLELFGELAFPAGTVSYIGARTGRGKSSVLVNIAREALFKENNKVRKVIFITLEMSRRQILNKLILSRAYEGDGELLKNAPYPNREIDGIIGADENKDIGGDEGNEKFKEFKEFRSKILEARNDVYKSIREKKFILFDGREKTESKIMNFIVANGKDEAIVLIDYVQKIPPKDGTDKDSYRRVQAISNDLQYTAAKSNTVIISAAQFVRSGAAKDGGTKGDQFSEESFRECGDLEQDAHNAIGIGWEADKKSRFYEILKTREDDKQGDKYNIDFVGAYSYMKRGEECNDNKDSGGKGKKEKKLSKPPASWGSAGAS
jgi:replicative DNA helicase